MRRDRRRRLPREATVLRPSEAPRLRRQLDHHGETLAQRRAVFCLDPLHVVLARPRLVDLSSGHPPQRMARARMDEREVEVTDEQADGDEREDVVDGARAVEDEAVVALAEPEEEAGEGEEEREGYGQERVDLLAGVEASLWRPPS